MVQKKKKSIGGLWLTYLVSGVHICFRVWRLWEYIMFHSKHKGETRGGSSVSQNNGSAVWRDNGSWRVVDNHCIFWYVGIIKQIHYIFPQHLLCEWRLVSREKSDSLTQSINRHHSLCFSTSKFSYLGPLLTPSQKHTLTHKINSLMNSKIFNTLTP